MIRFVYQHCAPVHCPGTSRIHSCTDGDTVVAHGNVPGCEAELCGVVFQRELKRLSSKRATEETTTTLKWNGGWKSSNFYDSTAHLVAE